MKFLILAAALFVASVSAAHARHVHRGLDPGCNILFPCDTSYEARPAAREPHREVYSVRLASTSEVVAHPAGCPRRAFCGCGAAVRVFGSPVRSLWLAANWYRYPRSAPGPGMVAVRRHHVMVIEASSISGRWIVYDANSGSHATRIHERSLAGYTIVNPRG